MALFFFLSGLFTPGSYDRKGPAHFLLDRSLRLLLPTAVYIIFIVPAGLAVAATALQRHAGAMANAEIVREAAEGQPNLMAWYFR